MQITEQRIGSTIYYKVEGRLDVNGSQLLDNELSKLTVSPVSWKVVLDFSAVEYISSAGIRALLTAQKNLKNNHELIIKNPSKFCCQVFEVTGADIFLKI